MIMNSPRMLLLCILCVGLNICEAQQSISSCSMNFQELFRRMNVHDYDVFIEFVRCRYHYDGGDLEDLYRASGLYLEINPERFLDVLKDFKITKREMENFLLMLPLNTVDDIDLKKDEINKRINLLILVRDSELKIQAIEILKNELVFLEKVKSLN